MPNFDAIEHKFITRQEKFIERVCTLGVEYVLVFGYGSALGAGSKSHGAMRYLSDWDSHEAVSLLVLSKKDRLLLVGSPFMVPAAQQKYSKIDVASVPPAEWIDYLMSKFGENLAVGTIGFDEMPMSIYRSISPFISGPKSTGVDHQLAQMRLQKELDELAFHKKGAAICDELFSSLKEEFGQDRPVWEIQLALETRARSRGADYCKTWLTVRPCADYPRYWPEECQHVPQARDQILFGIALSVSGHWAHGIRMGAVGSAQKEHRLLWQLVMDMMGAGAECLQPGNRLSSCELTMNEVLDRYKSGKKLGQISRFRNGHGLGTSYEDPLITDHFPQHFGTRASIKSTKGELIVKPSMLFELHPNVFLTNVGGAAIGEMLLTTNDGTVNMLSFPTELFEL